MKFLKLLTPPNGVLTPSALHFWPPHLGVERGDHKHGRVGWVIGLLPEQVGHCGAELGVQGSINLIKQVEGGGVTPAK